jgi:hypothetical protein
MVMTTPLWMVIGETNDRTTKGSEVVTAGNEGGAGPGERAVVRRALETASLSLLIARHGGGGGMQDAVAARAWLGERCDPLARGCGGSGAGCRRGGPELGGAAAGERSLLLGAAGGGERVECLLDAVGGEVALAEVADLGACEPVG